VQRERRLPNIGTRLLELAAEVIGGEGLEAGTAE
jgi:hypothetical protein